MSNTTLLPETLAITDWQPNRDGRITRMYASDRGSVGLVTEQDYGGEILSQTVQLLSKRGGVIEELDASQLREHITSCFAVLAELEGAQDYYDRVWLAMEALS